MAKYTITLTTKARKQLDKLDDHIARPVIDAIGKLADNPRPHGYKKLKGRDACRIRSGDYRIIYNIYDRELVVDVVDLGHRRFIYE